MGLMGGSRLTFNPPPLRMPRPWRSLTSLDSSMLVRWRQPPPELQIPMFPTPSESWVKDPWQAQNHSTGERPLPRTRQESWWAYTQLLTRTPVPPLVRLSPSDVTDEDRDIAAQACRALPVADQGEGCGDDYTLGKFKGAAHLQMGIAALGLVAATLY